MFFNIASFFGGISIFHSYFGTMVILYYGQYMIGLVGLRKPLLKKINYIKNTNFHQKQSSVEKKYPAVGDRKNVKRVRPYVEAKLRSSAKVAAKVFVVCIQCVFVISA